MERFIVVLAVIVVVIITGIALKSYQSVAEPFVLTAQRNRRTNNPNGRYSDEPGEGNGFFHCKRDDDFSEKNASLPTCSEMRKGMIQKAREEGQVPEIPSVARGKYPATDDDEVIGRVGNLQVILNRTAKPARHKMCVPFVDCDRYVNPKTKSLYCPVGIQLTTDSRGGTNGCHTFPENAMLNCDATATPGSGRTACGILRNIQTVGEGFKMYPPESMIRSVLHAQTKADIEKEYSSRTKDVSQKERNLDREKKALREEERRVHSVADHIVDEKSGIVLNMIRSYEGIMHLAEKESFAKDEGIDLNQNLQSSSGMLTEISSLAKHHMSVLKQFYDGVMESYLLYQPLPGGHARVGFIRNPGHTPTIPDLGSFDRDNIRGRAPSYEIPADSFIPDTMTPPDNLMPVLTPHKQTNYRNPHPSHPHSRFSWGWNWGWNWGWGGSRRHNRRPRPRVHKVCHDEVY